MNKNYHLWKDNFVLTFRDRAEKPTVRETGTARKTILLQLMLLAIIMAWSGTAFGQGVFTSAATGDWNVAGSWTLSSGTDADGIPDADDNVTIAATHTINLDLDAAVNNLNFAAGTSKLNFNIASKTLTVFGNIVGVAAGDDYVTAAAGLNASGTKILFSGAATQVITSISDVTNWPDFEVNKSAGSLTLSQHVRIDGNLIVTAGTFDAGSKAIVILPANNITVAASSSLINVDRVAQTNGGTAKNNSITIDGLFSTSTGAASINTITLTVNSTGVLDMKGTGTGFVSTAGLENPTTMTCNTGSTVKYSGPTTQTGRFANYWDLELSGTVGQNAGLAAKTISAVSTMTINNNLTISNGARFLGGGNYVVTGTTTINDNGEILWNGGSTSTFTFNGPVNINGNSGNGVIRFGGASTLTPTYTFNGDVAVSAATTVGAFALNSSATDATNRTFEGIINLNGNVTAASGTTALFTVSTTNPPSTNVRFGGTNKSLTLSTGTSFINLRGDITFTTSRTISAPGGGGFAFTTRPSSVSPEWTVQIDNGATLTVGSGTYIILPTRVISNGTGAGNLQVDGDLRIGLAGGWNSAITNTGTTTLGSASTVTFNGTAAQVTGASLPLTVNKLTINNAAGVTLSGNATINSALTLTAGTLATGANTLTLKGATSGSGLINTGASGTLVYNGAAAQTVSNLTASTANNLIVDNAAGVSVGADATVNNDLTITSGSLTVVSGKDLTVKNAVVNNGTLTIENNANLIQENNVANTGSGNTIVKRNSNPLYRLDYTLWSSPVSGTQTLAGFSPLTTVGRFYTYDSGTDKYTVAAPTTPFATGTGYLIRMPNTDPTTNYDAGTATLAYPGAFTGTPNNGTLSLSGLSSDKYYAVGNPYPSTIDASLFLAGNSTGGTLYFWRKTNGLANTAGSTATGTAYATWTTLGTAASEAAPNNITPDGTIAVGQGFIVKTGAAATSLNFSNTMRTGNNSAKFFKTKQAAQKDRVWLNLTNSAGAFSQALVGYMDGATLGVDNGIDGKYINDSAVALTSNIDNQEYTIQGRPAFDPADIVALNFKTDKAGDYTIAIDHFDGVFAAGQDIYLVDSKTGAETDLKAGAYTFAATAGVDNARFTLKYQKTLKVDAPIFNDNSVKVYTNNGTLYVNSGDVAMANVKVFDIQGRMIAELKNLKTNMANISNLKATRQVLIVKITSQDNTVVNKKVVN
jgi:hypothetical protein